MRLLTAMVVAVVFLPMVGSTVSAKDDDATMQWEYDGYVGLFHEGRSKFIKSSDYTEYTPHLGPIPQGVVIDEVMIFMDFETQTPARFEDFVSVNFDQGSNLVIPAVLFDSFIPNNRGRDPVTLVVSYSFHDIEEEFVANDPTNWTFRVRGNRTIDDAAIYVTYHHTRQTRLGSMQDLYNGEGGFPGDSILYALPDSNTLLSELSNQSIPMTPIPEGSEKFIVLIHGWNPDGRTNHYAPNDDSRQGSLDFFWQNLGKELSSHEAVTTGNWVVCRYDWHDDANTGGVVSGALNFLTKNANNARDAGQAHGLKLANLIGRFSPKEVHFIAHSAGSWIARRAAKILDNRFGSEVELQITCLDPFVNDKDLTGVNFDLRLDGDFYLMGDWPVLLENYYVNAGLTDVFGYTSGNYDGWAVNVNLGGGQIPLYDAGSMANHSGPIEWYARTVDPENLDALRNGTQPLGFLNSLAVKEFANLEQPIWLMAPPETDDDGTFTIAWQEVTGATGYTLMRVTLTSNTVLLDKQNVLMWAEEQIPPGEYWYYLWAFNSLGGSDILFGGPTVVKVPNDTSRGLSWEVDGPGQIDRQPQGTDVVGSATTGSARYEVGTTVTLTAQPEAEGRFVGWEGPVADPNALSTTILMGDDQFVLAQFETGPSERYLFWTITGQGGIERSPESDNVGEDEGEGIAFYEKGTMVTLKAIPQADTEFISWTGPVADPSSASTTVILNEDTDVQVSFAPPDPGPDETNSSPGGDGKIPFGGNTLGCFVETIRSPNTDLIGFIAVFLLLVCCWSGRTTP